MRAAADEPARAVQLAERVAREARETGDREAGSVAERALGLAYRELLDVETARKHLVASIALADEGGLPHRAAEARLSLAVELVVAGHPAAALRELGRASRSLGDAHPQVHCQLALVYARFGRYDEALESGTRALEIAQQQGEPSVAAIVLGNRGLVQAYRGDLAAAEQDLRAAQALCTGLGERLFALEKQHNLGWLLTRRGRLPEALALLDDAEHAIAELDVPLAVYRLDRAEALLVAGLSSEAATVAADAAAELSDAGRRAELAEAQLLQARAELLASDASAAARSAEQARDLFAEQDRGTWAALAGAVLLQARARLEEPDHSLALDVQGQADLLAGRGLRDAADDTRLLAGQLWTALGRPKEAAAQLSPLADQGRARSSATRVRAWHATLLLEVGRGRDREALRAARHCLDALEEQRAALGATDLHAASAVHGAAVANLALALACRRGPAAVLEWSERLRSSTLQHAPARPPGDIELAHDLEQLRTVSLLRRQSELDDDPSPALLRRQLALEEAVRRRARHAREGSRHVARPPTLTAVRALLGDRRLVSLFSSEGRVQALVVAGRSARIVDCGRQEQVEGDVRHLRLALRRAVLGQPRGSAAMAAAALRVEAALADALQGDGPVLVVPTPALASVPWSALPVLAGRDVEVTPTLALWAREQQQRVSAGVVVVAGPDLPQAPGEAQEVAACWPGAVRLAGADATAGRVLAALDGAHLAHLACHGTFRAENPLFSALLMADGPLTVYDLERLDSAPEHVVLSACDSGRGADATGQELLGLAAAFFARGTRTLVASVVAVDDGCTRLLMGALHREWSRGTPPVTALRRAQEQLGVDGAAAATAAAFVCLTSGQTFSG